MSDSKNDGPHSQLEYARKLRLHQDLLRFAIPGAYLAYLGASASSLGPPDQKSVYYYVIAGLIGIAVFIATIAEHYHYVVFRNWGAKLEQALFGAPNMVATQKNGDQTSPNETRSLQLHGDIATQRAIEVDTLEKAKAKYPEISRPDISHVTMAIVLFCLATATSAQLVLAARVAFTAPDDLLLFSVGTLLVALQMLIYKFWHGFYLYVIHKGLLAGLKTR